MNKIIVALKAVIVYKQKVLIIQRSKDDEIDAGIWEFAGGKLEFGEDLLDCLKREIKEEVNLCVTVEGLLYATTFKTDPVRQVVILTYLCHTNNDNVNLSNEHSDFIWADKEHLLKLLAAPIIKDLNKNNVMNCLDIM